MVFGQHQRYVIFATSKVGSSSKVEARLKKKHGVKTAANIMVCRFDVFVFAFISNQVDHHLENRHSVLLSELNQTLFSI